MKRILALVASCVVLLSVCVAYAVSPDTFVCVTPTGTKYHRFNCSYIQNSFSTMTISDAEQNGYEPCSRCRPDVFETAYRNDVEDQKSAARAVPSGNTGVSADVQQVETKTEQKTGFFRRPIVSFSSGAAAAFLIMSAPKKRGSGKRLSK